MSKAPKVAHELLAQIIANELQPLAGSHAAASIDRLRSELSDALQEVLGKHFALWNEMEKSEVVSVVRASLGNYHSAVVAEIEQILQSKDVPRMFHLSKSNLHEQVSRVHERQKWIREISRPRECEKIFFPKNPKQLLWVTDDGRAAVTYAEKRKTWLYCLNCDLVSLQVGKTEINFAKCEVDRRTYTFLPKVLSSATDGDIPLMMGTFWGGRGAGLVRGLTDFRFYDLPWELPRKRST